MKLIITIFALLLVPVLIFSEGDSAAAPEGQTRLAVLELVSDAPTPGQTAQMGRMVREAFAKTGMFYVIGRQEMEKRAAAINEPLSSECFTEKCALDAGEILAASKIVVGEVDADRKLYILKLRLFNLETRNFEAKAMVASDCPPEQWDKLAFAGVCKLLSIESPNAEINLVNYKGREVHRRFEWLTAGGLAVAGAVVWGIASGASAPSGDKKNLETAEYKTGDLAWQTGAFADLMPAARPHGMGGAYVALSDDANALAYNPAGLSRVRSRAATAGYLRFKAGDYNLPYFYAGYAGKATRVWSHGQAVLSSSSAATGLTETQVITGVSRLFDSFGESMRPFSAGLNLKFLMMNAATATDEVYAWQDNAVEGGGFGFSLDYGMQFELSERITAAFLLRDLWSRVGYTNVSTGESYSEGVPMQLVIGGHYRLMNSVNLVLDGNKSLTLDTEDRVRLGIEKWLFNALALRVGMSQAFSMVDLRRYHFGVGLDFGARKTRVTADWSYEYFTMEEGEYTDLSGSQRFAVGCRF